MASYCMILRRGISTSCVCHGVRNFKKFLLYNKRGSFQFKEQQRTNPNPYLPIDKRGTRDIGFKENGKFNEVPEMIPELIVPSLEGFNLKPYVSYRTTKVLQKPFTAKDLFDAVYAEKIVGDYKNNQLFPNGDPMNPSEYENLTAQEAKDQAAKTGCDMFCTDIDAFTDKISNSTVKNK